MNSANHSIDAAMQRLRPVLVTLAEAMITRAYRGDIEASDLVQQTLLEAHRESDRLETLEEGQVFSWLRTALRNNLLDAVKHLNSQRNDVNRRVRESDLEESFARLEEVFAGDDTSPSQILQRQVQITTMLMALQDLTDNQRTAVVMKNLQGHTLREIDAALDLTESAAAGLLHRGRQQLLRRVRANSDA